MRRITLVLCLPWFAFSAIAQCIPSFEKPFEIDKGEVLQLSIPLEGMNCSGCSKLIYGTSSTFAGAKSTEIANGSFVVVVSESEIPEGAEHLIYYRLICQGNFEKGEIKVVRKADALIGEKGELFSVFVLDTEAFNQKKPFRISVKAHGFPNAMITCSGCKDIDQVDPMVYSIVPGFAGSITITITGVTKEGDITDLGERVLEFP